MISLKLKKDHKLGLIKKLQLRASVPPNRTDVVKLVTFSAFSVAIVTKTVTVWSTALDLSAFIPMLFFCLIVFYCLSHDVSLQHWLPLFTCLFNVIALG